MRTSARTVVTSPCSAPGGSGPSAVAVGGVGAVGQAHRVYAAATLLPAVGVRDQDVALRLHNVYGP